jgi:hypothetical protein
LVGLPGKQSDQDRVDAALVLAKWNTRIDSEFLISITPRSPVTNLSPNSFLVLSVT